MSEEKNIDKTKALRTRKINQIIAKTKAKMEILGTYKIEFDATIRRYAEMTYQYKQTQDEWYANGCQITEEYTNKAGYTNIRKTALYIALETLRKELLELENVLGLTPKGLKQLRSDGFKGKQISALDKVLMNV